MCGLVPERADHILLECPRLLGLRAECFRTWIPGESPNWEVDRLLKFLESDAVKDLEEPDGKEGEDDGDRDSDSDQDGLD